MKSKYVEIPPFWTLWAWLKMYQRDGYEWNDYKVGAL